MRFTGFFVLAAAIVGLAAAPPDKVTKESITSGGKQRTYYQYVPPKALNEPVPLIVLLHGAHGPGNQRPGVRDQGQGSR